MFLFREKHLAIAKKYVILNEDGQSILFVERPARMARRILAVLAGIVAAPVFGVLIWCLLSVIPNNKIQIVLAFVALVGSIVILFATPIWLSPRRHVTVYRDESKQEALLCVLQAWKWGFIARQTVTDATGEVLAKVRQNRVYNFLFRKQWQCYGPDGSILCLVKEDSALLSLLRQFGSRMFGALKTNFILLQGETENVIGEFNRKINILNRYALDLKANPTQSLDRRVAVAIGVILDMDEKPWVT